MKHFGLQTLKNRIHFHKLKWYYKIMCLPNIRLLVKLLSRKWEREKCRGCHKKSWVAGIESLHNELDIESKAF